MKKSEIIARYHTQSMADAFGLDHTRIKLALVGPERQIETVSIRELMDLATARHLFQQAKSLGRKEAIARQALELCASFDDFNDWVEKVVGRKQLYALPRLRKHFHRAIREYAEPLLANAESFAEIYVVWNGLAEDGLSGLDLKAWMRMKAQIYNHKISVKDVIAVFLTHGGTEFFDDEASEQFELFLLSCSNASPEDSQEALLWLRKIGRRDIQSSYPINILIKKAAQLYLMR